MIHYYTILQFNFLIGIATDRQGTPESDTDNSKTGIHIIQYSSLKTLIHVIYSQALNIWNYEQSHLVLVLVLVLVSPSPGITKGYIQGIYLGFPHSYYYNNYNIYIYTL